MSAPDATAVERVRDALQRVTPATATPVDIETAVLASHGQRNLAHALIRESYEICARARKRVRARSRARAAELNPRGRAIAIVVGILTVASVVPLGLLHSIRLGSIETPLPSAVVTVAVAAALLLAVLLSGRRPLAFGVYYQVFGIAVLLMPSVVVGASISQGTLRAMFLGGGAAAVLAALVAFVARRSNKDSAVQADAATPRAYADVAPEVARERQMLIDALPGRLGDADVATLRSVRAEAFAAFAREGNPARDTDPDSVPGSYIVMLSTQNWVPEPHRETFDHR